MAFVEVEEDEYVPKGQFLKMREVFGKIGDKFTGIFVGASESKGQYGGTDYNFKTDKGVACLTIKGALHAQLQKAQLKGGECVGIQYKADKDIGKESPMKQFKLMVDREWGNKNPLPTGPNVVIPQRGAPPSDADAPF